MAYADLTAVQRQTLSRLASIAATETHRAREDFGVRGKELRASSWATPTSPSTLCLPPWPQLCPQPHRIR